MAMRSYQLLSLLLVFSCTGEDVKKNAPRRDMGLLTRYHWFRYTTKEEALPGGKTYQYVDTLTYTFGTDNSFRKRSQQIVIRLGSGDAQPPFSALVASGKYSIRGEGELTVKIAVPDRWRNEMDTVTERWLITELHDRRLTLVTPKVPGTFSRQEDTLQFVGVQK